MSAESLLLWMSARVQGSWPQFRAAVEELHLTETDDGEAPDELVREQNSLPLYQSLRLNLQRLGHAEFFGGAAPSDWRVTPPTLAVMEHSSGCTGVLVGARSKRLLQKIATNTGACELESTELSASPDRIRLLASDLQHLRNTSERAGIALQENAPAALLSAIPRVEAAIASGEEELPFGAEWRVERFSTSSLSWVDSDPAEPRHPALHSLYRFSRRYERIIFLCSSGRSNRVPGQVGKYLMLKRRRKRVLLYDSTAQVFSVPASCRPPFLVERALVLCSGAPPRYEQGVALLHYANVPAPIASLASELLSQDLR